MPQPGGRYTPHPAYNEVEKDPWLQAIYNFGPAAGSPGGISIRDAVEGTGAFAPGGPLTHLSAIARVPGAIASGLRSIPAVAGAAGTGLPAGSAGMHGADVLDQLYQKIAKAAGALAKRHQDIPDINQLGNETATKFLTKTGGSGDQALYKARSQMRRWSSGSGMPTGIRRGDRELVDKVVTKLGDVGSDKIAAELNRINPQGKWTYQKVQDTRGGYKVAHLDDPTDTTSAGLQSLDQLSPDKAVELKERLAGMTKAVRRDAEDLISGKIEMNKIDPKRLQRVRQAMSDEAPKKGSDWYDRAVAQKKRLDEQAANKRPISGGAPTPADMPVEFPASQFRPELRAGVGRQFGQEGPTAFKDMLSPVTSTGSGMLNTGRGPAMRELPQQISTMERTMAETGGGSGLGRSPVAGTANPVQDMMQWDRLRSMFKNIGMLQGNN